MGPPGHIAIAFAAKPAAGKASLWVLIAATEILDLLCFGFLAAGIERTGPEPLLHWSHGLFMSVVWSAVVGVIAYIFYRDRRTSIVIVLLVTDSGGLSDTQSFIVTVVNANDPPEFTSAPVTTATEATLYTYAVTTDDLDLIHGDALTITASTLPAYLALEDHGDGTATLAGAPGDDDAGLHLVVLRVTDRAGAFAEQEFVITVAERPRYDIYLPLVFRDWQP